MITDYHRWTLNTTTCQRQLDDIFLMRLLPNRASDCAVKVANYSKTTKKIGEKLCTYKIMRNFASESTWIMTNVETSQRELKIKFNRVNPYRE